MTTRIAPFLVLLLATTAAAQVPAVPGVPRPPVPSPTVPGVPGVPRPPVPGATPITAAPFAPGVATGPGSFAAAAVPPTGLGSLAGGARQGIPQMLGDNLLSTRQAIPGGNPAVPPPFPPNPPPNPPDPRLASALVPSVRGFKIAENQSPRPQDRLFYSFNYFDRVNEAVNRRLESPVANLRVYRHIFGFEKTYDDQRGSIGLRLPLNTLTGDPTVRGQFARPGGTSTSLGDLSIFTKYILKEDPETGSLISVGLVVTPPTGPDTFANANFITNVHTTTFQPFVGYIWQRGDFYLHGFSAFDFPVDPTDVTLMFNDFGMGYLLVNNREVGRGLTAVSPTFEVHVNTPLNYRNPFETSYISGTPDVVNLTYGVNFEFNNAAVLTLGFVTPVTGPKPFDYEAVVLFNLRFGGSRRPAAANLPFIGG